MLLFISTFLLYAKKYKAAVWVQSTAIILFLVGTTKFLPHTMVRNLEDKYPRTVELPDSILHTSGVNILVLGGGHTIDSTLPPNDQLSLSALGRLSEGIRIHRLLPGSKLILSGFSATHRITQAEELALTAASLGVDPADMSLQKTPATTYEEAKFYKTHFDNTTPLILVTSAVHMPRAMMLFHSQGLHPIPAPTAHLIKIDKLSPPGPWPSLGNVTLLRNATHEYVGMLYARHYQLSEAEKKNIQTSEQ